jgi:hypothetical protein
MFSQKTSFISYPEKNKLEWSDFNEITQNADTLINFNFDITIHMKTTKVNVWTGVTTFEAFGIYKLPTTWIVKSAETSQLLEYFQLQFDISNSIAKKLEADINKRRINGAYTKKMNSVFEEYNNRLNKILQKMDLETEKGKSIEKINTWRAKYNDDKLEI